MQTLKSYNSHPPSRISGSSIIDVTQFWAIFDPPRQKLFIDNVTSFMNDPLPIRLVFKRKFPYFKFLSTMMMKATILIVFSLFASGIMAEDVSTGMNSRFGGHHDWMGHPMCMTHCSYTCMASAGKIETCPNLLNPGNGTLDSLSDMAACPTTTTAINDCFLKCGCQCTRCTICLMKNLNPMAAHEVCMATPNPMMCMNDKKNEAMKKCN